MYRQHYKLYIFIYTHIQYGIWNNAIIDHTFNSLVEKVDQHKTLWEIRFINIFVTCFCAVDKSFYFTWLTIHIRITNSDYDYDYDLLTHVDACCVWLFGTGDAPMNSIWQRQQTNKQTDRQNENNLCYFIIFCTKQLFTLFTIWIVLYV